MSQFWKYMFIAEYAPGSQYDLLIELCQKNVSLPHGILCIAGEGKRFHGFKDRPWAAPPGNIYLSAFFAPNRKIDHFGPGFMILAAVSAIDAIVSIPGMSAKAGIKWVNDILIDNAKVGGVLAYTQSEGDIVTGAIIGIGLNVETAPQLEPTPFVPEVASLRDFAPNPEKCSQQLVLGNLIRVLAENFDLFVNGRYNRLLDRYRQRSMVVGRDVIVCRDLPGADFEELARGRVTGLGENLELFIEGIDRPVSKGRLILEKAN